MSDDALRKALAEAVALIKAAPAGTWGYNYMGDADVPSGTMSWPIEDEFLHHAEAALSAPPADVVGEHIVRAAIQWQGGVWSVPRPGRHGDVFSTMGKLNQQFTTQGFLTSTGRFVNRFEACDIARRAGQIIRKTGPSDELFSEDLW